jgi:hypothetical protein
MPKRLIDIETGRGSDGVSFRIKDHSSGVTLAAFRLDREQMYNLTGGSIIHVEADQTAHLDRVGKTMVVDQVVVTRADLTASTYKQMETDAEQLVKADRPGWDSYEARLTNRGTVRVVLRRWE